MAARAPKRVPFALGVNYWPRTSGHAMWRDFDAGEIAEDFARIAGLGLDTVRIFVRFDQFAPLPSVADPLMLRRFARVLSLAEVARLSTIAVLFFGHATNLNWLPAWALDARAPRGAYRTFVGDEPSPLGAGDLYREPLLEVQASFARTIGESVRDHPALRAWDLGQAFDRVRPLSNKKLSTGEHSAEPVDERAVAHWSRHLSRALFEASGRPATAGTAMDALTSDRSIRLGTLCEPFAFASMQGETVRAAFARSRLDTETLPFLAMLAAGFSHRPVFVTSFGAPTCPPDKFSAFERYAEASEPAPLAIADDDSAFATYPCLTEREAALFCEGTLSRLHTDGRLGALWSAWADATEALAARPPFDADPAAGTYGLIRADGTEKPVAAAFAAFARTRPEVRTARDMTAIASAYYYRTLPKSTFTLFEAYLRFVAERRAANSG